MFRYVFLLHIGFVLLFRVDLMASTNAACSALFGAAQTSSLAVEDTLGSPALPLVLDSNNKIYERRTTSQPANFYRDQNGVRWYLKKDARYAELQTGAEVISAWIYRKLGYMAPETYIVNIDGKRFSASRELPDGNDTTMTKDMPNERQFRLLRLVAAYLKDWDRLQLGPNNRSLGDNKFVLYDFGGTLGARARGEHKLGEIISPAIGSFGEKDSVQKILEDFKVDWLPENHPWRQFGREDAQDGVRLFQSLTKQDIEKVVGLAQFSNPRDRSAMINALVARRDQIVDNLMDLFGGQSIDPIYLESSFGARSRLIPPLSLEAAGRLSAQDAEKIGQYISTLEPNDGEVILFRGQRHLTREVVSPSFRNHDGTIIPRTLENQRQALIDYIENARQRRLAKRKSVRDLGEIFMTTAGKDLEFWERASLLDAMIEGHMKQGMSGPLIPTTRSLKVAAAGENFDRSLANINYVYILVAPQEQTVNVWKLAGEYYKPLEYEQEFALWFDATKYVKAIYDIQNHRFLDSW